MELTGGGGGSAITITEQDGSPSGVLTLLKVTNGTLTDNGGGSFSLITGGGGGTGISTINGDATSAQTLTVGTTGTDFAIVDNGTGDHAFNLPSASASARGVITATTQTLAGAKTFSGTITNSTLTGSQIVGTDGNKILVSLSTSTYPSLTELSYVKGVTSAIQTQIDAKGTGTVSTVSVVSANGFAGSVANATTTPAITLSLTTTGILSSTGTAIIAATTTGTGSVVLQTSPTITSPTIAKLANLVNNGVLTTTSNDGTLVVIGTTGTSSAVLSTSPTLVTPVLGVASGTSLTLSSLTGSQIVGTDASKLLVSLSTSTYPSLAELAFVKGVTSAIQTQLDSKGSGTVTSVGVLTANGLAGTVALSTTSATITLSITTSGILKGNGTSISSATAGVDYTALAFKTVAISGSSDVIATSAADTLTLVAGTGISISGSSSARSATITATGGGSGTVTSVSVVSANGFAGSVANPTTTPAITLSLTTNGILTSDGTAIIRATTTGTGAIVLQTSPSITSPTITTSTLSGTQQLNENASIRLDQTLSVDGTYSGTTIAITAGTNINYGDLVYLSAASNWLPTNANFSANSAGLLGIVITAASTSGTGAVLLNGNIRADAAFPTLTIGSAVYISTTTSAVQVAQPSGTDDVIRIVGFALTADSMYFDPSPDFITHT